MLKSVISIKLQSTLRHGCSPVNLLHNFRTPFPKNTSGGLLLVSEVYSEPCQIYSWSVNNFTKSSKLLTVFAKCPILDV